MPSQPQSTTLQSLLLRTKTLTPKPTPHLHPTDSDSSDSDSPLPLIVHEMTIFNTPSGKVPTLHAGTPTPQILSDLELAANCYFSLKKTPDNKKIYMLTTCFEDHRVMDILRIESERECMEVLSMLAFMAEVHKLLLLSDWECKLRDNVHWHRQGPDEVYTVFTTTVRDHLEMCLSPLQGHYNINKTTKEETDLVRWIKEVSHIDKVCHHEIEVYNEITTI
ncbi:hypothetical protein B0H17DRAFT_1192955 [Mycena rosella]|uniref:Uncharacterized protein n=1 Tax=Mycena rosella TaxID=1033263 RepID=A0AAD7M887_MYCRO|nr:hypothetical protein B0H17DRAFT_1192955 [Mycena rosella]